MTQHRILELAIRKAIKNGWQEEHWLKVLRVNNFGDVPIYQIIFNQDFAKALWGEEVVEADAYADMGQPQMAPQAWQYHLQQMVIADDPIKYLEGNI